MGDDARYGDVAVSHEAHVAVIRLARSDARNAISTALAESIKAACDAIAARADVRAVVLASARDDLFCVGADLKERASFTDAQLLAQRPTMRAAFAAVVAMPMPIIAAVEGYALGGGLELALSCDLIVAGQSAEVGLPEVTVGLVPGGGGTQLLVRRLGHNRAAELVYTGRRVPAAEAAVIGLIDRLVPAGDAVRTAMELAAQIAGNSPVGVRAAKRALRTTWLDAGLEQEDAAWRGVATSADRREGIAAFVEKRPPIWPGVAS